VDEDRRREEDADEETPDQGEDARLTPGSDEAKKAESEEEAEDEVRQSIDDAFD
jgi:hypothetical protein